MQHALFLALMMVLSLTTAVAESDADALDYDELMNSGCLFARKFSIVQDDKIVRKITSAVLNG